MAHALGRWLVSLVAALAVVSAPVGVAVMATPAAAQEESEASDEFDKIILKNGRVVRGEILSESPTSVRIEINVGGIKAPTEYDRSEIQAIRRAAKSADGSNDADTGGDSDPRGEGRLESILNRGQRDDDAAGDPTVPSVYFMELSGWFGSEIAPHVVERYLEDVKRQEPDFLVVELNRRWAFDELSEIPDGAQGNFDEFSSAQAINDYFLRNLSTWRKRPHVVMWVKNAMGGLAFTPFLGDDIVFHPEGRMGGVGTLEEMFEGVGDRVVRQKQRSLRLARAQGLAIQGGYDPKLVTAMAMRSYELSFRLDGGVAELYEGLAQRPNETNLTEDGTIRENQDSFRDMARGTTDDVLTLREDTAKIIGVSMATTATQSDVLDALGILRKHRRVDDRAERIIEGWKEEVARVRRQIPRDLRELAEIPNGGADVREARRNIGRRIQMLEKLRGYRERYGDVIMSPHGFGDEPPGWLFPGVPEINFNIQQLRMQLMLMDD